ncbi:ABC transporter permease [Streptomyces sp. NPDC002033]|uniref:ABC transporter permease n=1 Tax=unclassified Streptomyces TaxID=2593676 RepID=UPI00331E709D
MTRSRRAPLWWQLMRVGAAAAREAPAGRVRFVALACATLAASLALCAITLVLASYEGRDLRDAARSPVRPPQAAPAALLYRPAFDVVDDLQFQVAYVLPLRDDAPLPPGVAQWPRPGQALLSPALLAAGRDEGIETRYGTVAGTIAEEGLASPGERFAYVRPMDTPTDTSRMWPVVRFGAPSPSGIGENLFVKPIRLLLVIAVLMGALPAAALAVSSARAGSDARDQRTALLGALGGGWRARAVINIGEAALPVAVGALLGVGLSLCVLAQDTRLPLVGYTLAVADARRWVWAVAGAPPAAAALVLLSVVLVHPPQDRGQGPRPRLVRTRLPRWWPYLCPFMVFLAVQGPALAPNPAVRLLVYATGVGGTLLTLPSLTGLVAVAAGHALARLGRRTGRSGALVSGRWAAAWPGATVRLTAGVVIAFVLVGQTQLWVTRNTGPAVQAQQTVKRVGSSVILVEVGDDKPIRPEFLAALPSGVEALRLSVDGAKGTAELNGPCAALRRLSLPCTPQAAPVEPRTADVRVRELHSWDTPGQGLSARQASTPKGAVIVLVGDPGRQISVPEVKEAANRHLGMAVPVGTIAGSWLASATMDDRQGLWVLLFGAFAVLVTALSIVVSNLAEFVRFSRRITALSVLTGNRTIYLSTAFFTLFVPLLAASLIGLATHYWLATPLTTGAYADGASLSRPVLVTVLATSLAVALLVWLWGAHGAVRLTSRWRPTAD